MSFARSGRDDYSVTWDGESAKKLGDALRSLRAAKELTQESLAYQAGITKNQVQLIESGRSSGRKDATGPSNPRISTLAGLAEVLEIRVSELLLAGDL